MTTHLEPHPDNRIVTPPRSSIVAASAWMVGLTLALFFLPLLNGIIGGFVGGYKVGGAGRALLAAILPAIVVAIALWIIFAVFDAPVIGVVAGLAGAALVVLADIGIFIGALIGGAMSKR